MNLYYHVVRIEKRRKCKFNFSYSKGIYMCILGSVDVEISKLNMEATFDGHSACSLDPIEKDRIVSSVMRNIFI